MQQSKIVDGKRVGSDGKELPKHIQATKIPPAWTDVVYSSNPKSDLLVKGKDLKGRCQYIYSESHWNKSAKMKFARIKELDMKMEKVKQENERNLTGKNSEEATILKLIMETGIRPGSDEDTKSEKKAYGATTLETRHVVSTKNGMLLNFVGKKGVENKVLIKDKYLIDFIFNRIKQNKEGKLFKSSYNDLLNYTSSLDGGKFKTKDFRTLLGTKTAMEEIQKVERPEDEKKFKKAVLEVAKKVAERLGNTPGVALTSYISPVVWEQWRTA